MGKPDEQTPHPSVTRTRPPHLAPGQAAELSLAEVQAVPGASRDGLSQAEAYRRLAQYGYNELAEKEANPFLQFLSYLWGPIPWMIEVAALLSALVRDWTDFGIILVLLGGNAVVGFWEEYQAGNAIAALKARLALHARVKRAGTWTTIPARELVPGDLIRLRLGDIVPADAHLLDGDPVEVGTQLLATLIAVYGLFMTPIGWGWALLVWGYALVWFVVNDRVKVAAYHIFDLRQLDF